MTAFVGNETIEVFRMTNPAGVDPATGYATTDTFTKVAEGPATVNPVPGEELAQLPEGQRSGEQRRAITTLDIRGPDEQDGTEGDLIRYDGRIFKVLEVQSYRRVIPHLEVRVRLLDRDISGLLP